MLIDIHHHIVYGVDDGPQTLEDSQKMLKRAEEQGLEAVCATSHCMPGYEPYDYQTYADRLKEETEWCREEGLAIRLLPGAEIMFSETVPDLLLARKLPTLNGTGTVLLEFLPEDEWTKVENGIRAVRNAGYEILLAHAERYECLRTGTRIKDLKREYGVLIQMNCSTVLEMKGFFGGDRWARKILKDGTVDLVASDSHSAGGRRCRMKACFEKLCREFGAERAGMLCGGTAERILWPKGKES